LEASVIIPGDCVTMMPQLEAGSARLVFADPPSNIGIDSGDHPNDRMGPAEYLAWCRRWISAALHVLAPDGSLGLLCNPEWSARLQLAMEATRTLCESPVPG
jgi:DNA modification methylase